MKIRVALAAIAGGSLLAGLAACSSSGPAGGATGAGQSSPPAVRGITIFHDGFALPPCNFGMAPAPCQRRVSPIETDFVTPVSVSRRGQGGYDVKLVGGSIAVTAYVDGIVIGPCPSGGSAACLSDPHNLDDDAGAWEIRY